MIWRRRSAHRQSTLDRPEDGQDDDVPFGFGHARPYVVGRWIARTRSLAERAEQMQMQMQTRMQTQPQSWQQRQWLRLKLKLRLWRQPQWLWI